MIPDARTTSSPTAGRGTAGRPDAVEWHGKRTKLEELPPGAPLTAGGQLLVSTRDASWLCCPEVRTIKALHAAVVSHTVAAGGGMTGVAAACAPSRILLDDGMLGPAADAHPDGLCQRPACQRIFARHAETTATASATAPAPR